MKQLSEMQALIQEALKSAFLSEKQASTLNNFDEMIKFIDNLEHQIYSAIEKQLNKDDGSQPFHERTSVLESIGVIHNTLAQLEEAYALAVEDLLTERSQIMLAQQVDLTSLDKNSLTTKKIFFEFYDEILNFSNVNDQQKKYLCSSIFKLMSRPNGQNIINMLLKAGRESKLTITFTETDDGYKTTAIEDLANDPKDYYLRENNTAGPDVMNVKIEFPFNMRNQISIVVAYDQEQQKAGFSFQPAFLSLGHELYHAVGLFTGQSRAKLTLNFPLGKPESRLYPDPQDAEEFWVIEQGDFSENSLRAEHLLLSRVGHEGKPLIIQENTAKLPPYVTGITYSSALVTAIAMQKLIAQDFNFEGYWLQGVNFGFLSCNTTNFQQANLEDAEFTKTNLKEAIFINANLEHAVFREANLAKANFAGANLKSADLTNSILEGACFKNANLSGAILKKVNLIGAILDGASFSDKLALSEIIKYNLELISKSSLSLSDKQNQAQALITNIVSQIKNPQQLSSLLHDMLTNSGFLSLLNYTLGSAEKGPYDLLRQETGYFRLSHGNTAPWNKTIIKIKDQYLQSIKSNTNTYSIDEATSRNIEKLLAIRSDRSVSSFFFADPHAKKFNAMQDGKKSTITFKKNL